MHKNSRMGLHDYYSMKSHFRQDEKWRKSGGKMNTLLNYPGAKWGMAREIVGLMPGLFEMESV